MQEVSITLDGMAHGGEAVGTIAEGPAEGKRLFVAGALSGEKARVGILSEKKRYAKGVALEILEASEDRVEAPCALADRCGGCNWQHLRAERQASYKAEIAQNQLRRVLPEIQESHASPQSLGYRRRARLHVHKAGPALEIGFYSSSSNEVVAISDCPILIPELRAVLDWLYKLGPYLVDKAQIHLLGSQGKVLVGVSGTCPLPEQKGELLELLKTGPQELCGLAFRGQRSRLSVGAQTLALEDAPDFVSGQPLRCGPFDFAQAQSEQNRRLLELVSRHAKASKAKHVLELYCGAGNLTRVLAGPQRRVEAWDDARGSIEALRRRVAKDERNKVLVHGGTALKALRRAKEKERSFDLVVVDPPRTGLGKKVVQGILELAPAHMIYVSCDLATLARDLELLQAQGYRCVHAAMVDMMPMTSEIEMVVRLERGA